MLREYDGGVGAQQNRDQRDDDRAVQSGNHAVSDVALPQRGKREQAEANAERKRQQRRRKPSGPFAARRGGDQGIAPSVCLLFFKLVLLPPSPRDEFWPARQAES
jgi:hypothetical protein